MPLGRLYICVLVAFIHNGFAYSKVLDICKIVTLIIVFTICQILVLKPNAQNRVQRVNHERISASHLQHFGFRLTVNIPKKSSLFWIMTLILWFESSLRSLNTYIKACESFRMVFGKLCVRTTWIKWINTLPG